MDIAEVGGGSQRATKAGASGDQSLAFPANVTAGNLLVGGGAAFENGGPGAPTVSGSSSGSWTVVSGIPFTSGRVWVAYKIAPFSAADTVTVDYAGNPGQSFSIDEFSGVHATPLDVDGGITTGNSAAVIDNITTATPAALILVVMANDIAGTTALTEGEGLTKIGEEEANNSQDHALAFKIGTSAKLYWVGWSMAASGPWGIYPVSFKPVDGTSGAGAACEHYQLEDGSGFYQLEDGSGGYLLEGSAACGAADVHHQIKNMGKFHGWR